MYVFGLLCSFKHKGDRAFAIRDSMFNVILRSDYFFFTSTQFVFCSLFYTILYHMHTLQVERCFFKSSPIHNSNFSIGRQTETRHILNECWIWHLNLCLLPNCSPISSLPSVRTLLRPQGALPLRLSLPAPLGQQDLHVLLPPQQHRIQILLQRDRVPDDHAAQPHHHLRWICTQVS